MTGERAQAAATEAPPPHGPPPPPTLWVQDLSSTYLLLLALGSRALGDTDAVQHDLHALLEGAGQLPVALLQLPLLQDTHSHARGTALTAALTQVPSPSHTRG